MLHGGTGGNVLIAHTAKSLVIRTRERVLVRRPGVVEAPSIASVLMGAVAVFAVAAHLDLAKTNICLFFFDNYEKPLNSLSRDPYYIGY
jgi:hypothetical protein